MLGDQANRRRGELFVSGTRFPRGLFEHLNHRLEAIGAYLPIGFVLAMIAAAAVAMASRRDVPGMRAEAQEVRSNQ